MSLAKKLSLPVDQSSHLVSRLTSLIWSVHLLATSPTPRVVKLASVACIYLAHNHLGAWFSEHWSYILCAQGVMEALAVQRLLLNRPKSLGVAMIVYLAARSALWKYLFTRQGMLKDHSRAINLGLVSAMTSAALSSKPLERTVSMGLYGWIIALLTDSKRTYFWSAGMMATLAQGVAHRIADEAGTLEVLQNDIADQLSYELSHVSFFPNLVFQACYAHLRAQAL